MARILIIDDNDLVRAALVLLLTRDGHEVTEAVNGEDALALFRDDRPDLVVTDVIMPEKEGFETMREMREIAPGMKIIVISGGGPFGAQDILQLASGLGADETFAKPIHRNEFLASVSRLLAAA
jgi:DNA-binding response OmpR family regulator